MAGRPHRARNSGPVNVAPAVARRAARHVAHQSTSAAECAEFLDMLGLTAQDGKAKP